MNTEGIDLSALLASWEAKRAALDTAIVSVKAAMSAGALGGAGESIALLNTGLTSTLTADIPDGAFNGKNIAESIKAYLTVSKRRHTTREIVDALKRGGMRSESEPSMRPALNKQAPQVPKKVSKKRSKERMARKPLSAQKKGNAEHGAGLPSRIEELLGGSPNKSFTPSQIATALSVNPVHVNVRLKKMVTRERVEKVGPGQYRAGKTAVVKMPVAG